MDLQKLIRLSASSSFYRTLLNWMLTRMIPFNKPHGFEITGITDEGLQVKLPYKRRNLNHIRGLHACALATVSEFTTGLLLISKLDPKKYRLIMQRLEMDYHYQGKADALASFSVTDSWLRDHVYEPLKVQDAVIITCEIRIHDIHQHHLTTGKVFWQVKAWENVRTKVRS